MLFLGCVSVFGSAIFSFYCGFFGQSLKTLIVTTAVNTCQETLLFRQFNFGAYFSACYSCNSSENGGFFGGFSAGEDWASSGFCPATGLLSSGSVGV